MLFACSKRAIRLKTIDSCFEDLKDSRLVDKTFTVDEVRDMLDGLKLVVRGEVETELVNTAHTNMLLLRQLFSQAEKFYLRLQTDISELENRWAVEWLGRGVHLGRSLKVHPLKCFVSFPKMATRSQEITSLEDTDNLVSAKHDLLRVQEQLALAEKELDRKFQQTSAYRNMKEILTKKNEHIKDTRKRQEKYESDE
uniref:Leucine zipper transcription factor-like protein 1 n=1 Tax=Oncorhynchus kisutch TaxID=8019 RepID=A0A8C7CLL1_ONCKI